MPPTVTELADDVTLQPLKGGTMTVSVVAVTFAEYGVHNDAAAV